MMKEAKKKNLSVRFSFRMTEEESKTLEETAKLFNVKPSDVARMAVSAAAVVANQAA